MKRFLSLFLTLLLLAFPAGCGNKKEQGVINNITQIGKQKETPKKGGAISIYSYKPDTLCPLLSVNNANIRMLNIVFDGLFTVDENLSVTPCLASAWTASENNKKYTVELKKNVQFHDGSSLSAEDVIFSVNTAKSEPQGPYYHNVSVIKEVKAAGENAVEFVLTKPLANFCLCRP